MAGALYSNSRGKATSTISKKSQAIFTVAFGIAVVAFAVWTVLLFNLLNTKIHMVNIFTLAYYACSVIAAISVYILIISVKNISKKLLILLPCLFYIIFSLCELFNMMGNVTGPDSFVPLQSLVISAFFIAPSLLLSLFFAFRKGKV